MNTHDLGMIMPAGASFGLRSLIHGGCDDRSGG